jgi:metal-responsive CopG/Arc/MetJ family transcriptional regulator
MANKTVQVRVPDALIERFDKALDRDGLNRSHVIMQAIREYVEDFEKRNQGNA